MASVITSDTVLHEINRHFRVSAGPGAGKTHWLAGHIRNVASRSSVLGASQWIASISYTNVAADQILDRLGDAAWRVQASTIHSFLFRHVVRPYAWMILGPDGKPALNYREVDGHEEHQPLRRFVERWLREGPSRRPDFLVSELVHRRWPETVSYLRGVRWHYEGKGDWKVKPPRMRPPQLLPTTRLDAYKKHYWDAGILDHDDVLYFAARLLREYPELSRFLAARFPYVFIDEFQDTNPAQMELVHTMANAGSIVGVIGDPEQAIFSFQGATRQAFMSFRLPGFVDYRLEDNRRSSRQIVEFLNRIRKDGILQRSIRNSDGPPVELWIGARDLAIRRFRAIAAPEHVILARTNDEVAAVRGAPAEDVWARFDSADGPSRRPDFWRRLLEGRALALAGRLGDAVARAAKAVSDRQGNARRPFQSPEPLSRIQCNGLALRMVTHLAGRADAELDRSIEDAYESLRETLEGTPQGLSMQRYRAGKGREFARQHSVRTLAAAVSVGDDAGTTRTIHRAKAAEFSDVLVCLTNEEDLDHVVERLGAGDEEQRIYYVAFSRAKDRLVVTIPTLSAERVDRLKQALTVSTVAASTRFS